MGGEERERDSVCVCVGGGGGGGEGERKLVLICEMLAACLPPSLPPSSTYLVHIFPLRGLEPHTQFDGVTLSSVEQVETKVRGRGPSHPHTVVCSHGNHGEKCGETLEAGVVSAPTCGVMV